MRKLSLAAAPAGCALAAGACGDDDSDGGGGEGGGADPGGALKFNKRSLGSRTPSMGDHEQAGMVGMLTVR